MRTFKIRNITIGEGIPKICVPLVGKSHDEILNGARLLTGVYADLVEWRADWYQDVFSIGKVMEILIELKEILQDRPMLFTFRTKAEGGEKELTEEQYVELLQEIATTGLVDLIDIEVLGYSEKAVKAMILAAREANVLVIGSNHDFEKTVSKQELIKKLCKMQELEADILKLAVMPCCKQDALTLMEATIEMKEQYADRPLVTMSMARDGVISRIAGEIFGSDITFGSVGRASAPGQLPAEELRQVLSILHHAIEQ